MSGRGWPALERAPLQHAPPERSTAYTSAPMACRSFPERQLSRSLPHRVRLPRSEQRHQSAANSEIDAAEEEDGDHANSSLRLMELWLAEQESCQSLDDRMSDDEGSSSGDLAHAAARDAHAGECSAAAQTMSAAAAREDAAEISTWYDEQRRRMSALVYRI